MQREELPFDSDSDTEKNEEKPVVVVLKEGDLTAEEAEKIKEKTEQGEKKNPIAPKIFKRNPFQLNYFLFFIFYFLLRKSKCSCRPIRTYNFSTYQVKKEHRRI